MNKENGIRIFEDRGNVRVELWKCDGNRAVGKIVSMVTKR